MNFIPYFVLLTTVSPLLTRSSIYTEKKDNVLNFIHRSIDEKDERMLEYQRERKKNHLDAELAQFKTKVVKRTKKNGEDNYGSDTNQIQNLKGARQMFRIDPVLNHISRRARNQRPKRASTSGSSSSSNELEQSWKDEWQEHWIQKKFEAINSSGPRGDAVNMLAARPWGVSCGDPNQHDMPWGSCMLPMECEAEFRIYRGDYFCGRTQFVCCALELTTYDMYQGFDVSFADSSVHTDSEERKHRQIGSKELKRKRKRSAKRRRKRDRLKRKRQIKRNIRKIIREIRRILSRTYRNGTTMRKKKTKQLKKFIQSLKDKYREDRKSVKNVHALELTKIDNLLQRKLDQIKGMNQDFIKNRTFRDIVVNGTVNPKAVRMLVQAYPELVPMLDRTRRTNNPGSDYLNYDIEYGLLYY